jgi:DNA adenine methylase
MIPPVVKIHGGKGRIWGWIVSNLPSDYAKYAFVEPFGGAASVMLNKEKSVNLEVYNDLDEPLYNIFYQAKRDPGGLCHGLDSVQYSKESFEYAATYKTVYGTTIGVQGAVNEIVRRRMSRGGLGKNFSWSDRLRGGKPGDVNAWENFKKSMPQFCSRVRDWSVFCKDGLEIMATYDISDVIIYADPGYLMEKRTAKKVYDIEKIQDRTNQEDIDFHTKIAELANVSKAKVIISGYPSDLYDRLLYKHWRSVEKDVPNNSGQGKTKQRRVEKLWMNY